MCIITKHKKVLAYIKGNTS